MLSQSRKEEILWEYNIRTAAIRETDRTNVTSVNNKLTRELIQKINPKLIVVNGTRIISKKVLECVDCLFVNTHLGITPMYRGVHGGYWSLALGDVKNFGATIHLVDQGVDTGGILEHVYSKPTPKDNFYTYPLLQFGSAVPKILECIDKLLQGDVSIKQIKSDSSILWYHPTIFQYIKNLVFKGVQ